MSIYGMQLPKQLKMQKVGNRTDGFNAYANSGFNWSGASANKKDKLYKNIVKGQGTHLHNSVEKTS